jgi:coenzyme PQQ precursor peptide PqqA
MFVYSRPEPYRGIAQEERNMAWTTPTVTEVCVGMEVTSYESAEI